MDGTRQHNDLVIRTIQEHAASLLRIARRYSYCADDAQDAYQRALEIFIRRAGSLERDTMAAWLRTVVKHEALAVRASRGRQIAGTEIDFDAREAAQLPTEDERAESFALMERSAEALKRLKPQEVRALLLRAQGHSYQEICELTGWSYTKVNRCISEGRRSFLDRVADIESGRECARWAPLLSAVADGEASAKDVTRLRPHLRHCPACRSRLGQFRHSPRQVAALVPVAAIAPGMDGGDAAASLFTRVWEAVTSGLHERAALSAQKLQATAEVATSGKVAAVAASAAALAGGGVAVTGAAGEAERPAPAAHVAQPQAQRAARPATPVHTLVAARRTTPRRDAAARRATASASRPARGGEFAPTPSGTSGGNSASRAAPPERSAPGPGEFEP
jgi:RNA polymerase sigma factor (sigma-70 family)